MEDLSRDRVLSDLHEATKDHPAFAYVRKSVRAKAGEVLMSLARLSLVLFPAFQVQEVHRSRSRARPPISRYQFNRDSGCRFTPSPVFRCIAAQVQSPVYAHQILRMSGRMSSWTEIADIAGILL